MHRIDSTGTLLSIGGLYEEIGRMDEAENAYRQAIEQEPESLWAYARLLTHLRGRTPPEIERRVLELVAANRERDPSSAGGRTPVEGARIHYAMAHAADATGEYAAAASALWVAKQAEEETNHYDLHDHQDLVEATINAYTPAWLDSVRGKGCPSQKPVFVFGLPRSGTTLVEQILARHPAVYAAGELDFGARSAPRPERLAGCNPDWIGRIAETHLSNLSRGRRAVRIVDKMPDNYLYLGWLAALFPKAKFLYVKRDQRDVALSLWMTDFRVLKWCKRTGDITDRIACHNRLMRHWDDVGIDVTTVEYEALVSDFEVTAKTGGTVRELCAWLGLEWHEDCLSPELADRPVRTASVTQVREPVHSRSVGRWTNYERLIPDLFQGLAGY